MYYSKAFDTQSELELGFRSPDSHPRVGPSKSGYKNCTVETFQTEVILLQKNILVLAYKEQEI